MISGRSETAIDLHISLAGRGDLSARIYRQLLDAVLDGRLPPSARLPPTRDLARRLAVSRNTVAVAYERLIAEGFLTGRVGAGTFVTAGPMGRAQARHAPAGAGVHPRRLWEEIVPLQGSPVQTPATYDFRAGMPDARLFPLTSWRRLVARELRPQAIRVASYGDPAGHEGLRGAIARFIGISRSVRAAADDVIVTHGAQQALDLIGRVLIDPGNIVAVEEPGYPPARLAFRSHGARVVGVPVDAEGLVVAAIPNTARVVYVTPSHQFPLGTVMSLPRRAALLAWAERRGAVIIEDDYDTEFRFEGRPLDPLQSLDRSGRVLYVGTFSKVMLPALRVGFLVAPASLQAALRTAKQLSDWHGELPAQAALARFIDEGLLARHIRKAGREYAARRACIAQALHRDFVDWLDLVPSAAGLHLTARVRPRARVDLDDVLVRAARSGVAVHALSRYYTNATADAGEGAAAPATAGLLIGYGAIATAKVEEGMKRLAASFSAPAPRRASPSRYSGPAGG
jgi:GntR family transcriptional regulator/MocR family aminotransferase